MDDYNTKGQAWRDFLTANWGNAEGYACLLHGGSHQFHRWPAEADKLMNALYELNQSDNAYVGWSLFGEMSRKSEVASCVPGVLLDVDLATGAHSKSNLPTTATEALEALRTAGLPKSSRVMHSGGGLYLHYLFDRAFEIMNDDDRMRVSRVLTGLTRRAQAAFKEKGWHLDNVSDLARITRVPGSTNWKYGADCCVELLETGPRYAIGDLESLVPSSPTPRQWSSHHDPAEDDGAEAVGDFNLVVQHCSFARRLQEDPTHVAEPEWRALATIAARCSNGRDLFHALSALDQTRYSRGETDMKLDQARTSKPSTCQYIAEDLNSDACSRCPFRAFRLNSPYGLARGDKQLLELQSRYVLNSQQNFYYPVSGAEPKSKDSFISHHSAGLRVEKGTSNPHTLFTKDRRSPVVDQAEYCPGEADLIVIREKDVKVLNTWRSDGVAAADGDCGLILNHLEYLVPDQDHRDWLLDYLANLLQRPEQKIKHAVMIIGSQGIGKSFLNNVLETLFGQSNVFVDTGEVHASTYRRQLGNRQVLVLEEMSTSDRFEVANQLKPWITQEKVMAQEKYDPSREVVAPRGIFIWTNRAVPVCMEVGDRRYFVLRCDQQPKQKAYYVALFNEGLQQAAAFKAFLLKRDIRNWSADAPPPITAAKEEIISGSRTPLASEILSFIEGGQLPKDLVRVQDIRNLLDFRREGVSEAKILNALREIDAKKLPKRIRTAGGLVWLWAIRNPEKWLNATPQEYRLHYEGQVYSSGQVLAVVDRPERSARGATA